MFCNDYKNKIKELEQKLMYANEKVEALNRATAVIEFDMHGKILNANDNFLETMGYSCEELIGKHHSMFMFGNETDSPEYKQFWDSLRSGKYANERFKRKKKNGELIWLRASYTPICGADGKPYKVVKIASDITKMIHREMNASAQIDAIDKVMAVIEFTPDGHIVRANQNFLDTMGYELAEIKCQHHSMFAVPGYAETAEYKQFWEDLAAGKFFSGTFERVGKGGKEVWLEASYNPIFSDDGSVRKVIKYASDVGNNPSSLLLSRVVKEANEVFAQMSQGNLNVEMRCLLDEIGVETMYDDQVADLTNSVRAMVKKLKQMILAAVDAADQSRHAAINIKEGSNSLNQKVGKQVQDLQNTAQTMAAMNENVQQTNTHVQQANEVITNVAKQTNQGVQVMQQTIEAMQSIQDSSEKIADIVTLIDGIAFQTNLLALNAAVEAARAGEQGRGFAVVAGEVRSLAQKSAEAAKDIKNLIEETVTRVNQGSSMATDSGEVLSSINQSIGEVTNMISQIANASVEQANGINSVNQGIREIENITHENAQLVERTSATADNLGHQTDELGKTMSFFNFK